MSSEASAFPSRALVNVLDIDSPARAPYIESEPLASAVVRAGLIQESSDEVLLALVGNGEKEALSFYFRGMPERRTTSRDAS